MPINSPGNPAYKRSGKSKRNTFSQRVSGPIGGNRWSGPFFDFPLQYSYARSFYTHFNDFDHYWDYDVAASTSIATTPAVTLAGLGYTFDWGVTTVGGGVSGNAQNIVSDAPFGLLRLAAGTADTSGVQVTRVITGGTNVAFPLKLDSTIVTEADNTTRFRPIVFGARFALEEAVGVATQSGFTVGLTRDDGAVQTTAGIPGTSTNTFGITKAPGTNAVTLYSRGTQNAFSSTLLTISPATTIPASNTTGPATATTFYEVAFIAEKHSASQLIIDGFVNGSWVTSLVTTASAQTATDDLYCPVFSIINGTGTDAVLEVDYYFMMSERY